MPPATRYVVHVLSDEEKPGFEHGFITAELIKKYGGEEYSIFMCGPQAMYNFLDGEIASSACAASSCAASCSA